MVRNLQCSYLFCFILFSIFFLGCSGESMSDEWADVFIKKYTQALQKQDTVLYESLIVSQIEVDSLIRELLFKVPNCITDVEKNITVDKLIKQFYQFKDYKSNISHIDINNIYAINGCGNVKGFKINIKCECIDKMIRYRTLTFITINGINKLMFDIEKN